MTLSNKFSLYLSYFLQLLLIISTLYSLYNRDYIWTSAGIFALFLTILPSLFAKRFDVRLPWDLNLLLVICVFLQVFGGMSGWYEAFPEYDKITHFFSSVTVAILGFVTVIIINQYSSVKMNRIMTIFFIIILTTAIGTYWELLEFIFDKFSGLIPWQADLEDTMLDLIFDIFGGILGAYIGDIYLENVSEKHFE